MHSARRIYVDSAFTRRIETRFQALKFMKGKKHSSTTGTGTDYIDTREVALVAK